MSKTAKKSAPKVAKMNSPDPSPTPTVKMIRVQTGKMGGTESMASILGDLFKPGLPPARTKEEVMLSSLVDWALSEGHPDTNQYTIRRAVDYVVCNTGVLEDEAFEVVSAAFARKARKAVQAARKLPAGTHGGH